MIGMGFAQTMMNSVLSASTMLSSAQAQRRAMLQTKGRIRILESEIKMGTGATEAKKQELSLMQERLKKASELQLGTLEDANTGIEKALEQTQNEKNEKTQDSNDEAKEAEKPKTIQELYQEIVDGKKTIDEVLNSEEMAKRFGEEPAGMAVDYML